MGRSGQDAGGEDRRPRLDQDQRGRSAHGLAGRTRREAQACRTVLQALRAKHQRRDLRKVPAGTVKAVLARSKRVEVHRLPSYAPELNPVEPMWGNGKGVKLRGIIPDDGDDLEVEAHIALEDIANDQPLLRSFFGATPLSVPGVTK